MNDQDYVILRFAKGGPGAPSPEGADTLSGGILEAPPGAGSDPSDVTLERASMSERQAADAVRDPQNIVAPDMPLTFVEPVAMADDGVDATSLQHGTAWGILSVMGDDPAGVTGAGVKVAVLDTGIERTHPAFDGMNVVEENFTEDDILDLQGHGTHCAGTICGRDVSGTRIGVARGVSDLLIGKVLDNTGRGSVSAVLDGLQWARREGANVVSMSLGFDFPEMQKRLVDRGQPLKLATSKALKAYRENIRLFETLCAFLFQETADWPGMVITAASGNESRRDLDPDFLIDVSVPASASANIISVGALQKLTDGFGIAGFSNINPTVSAPGVDIMSAGLGGSLASMSGTSMACPHVAGIAALWWEWAAGNLGRARGSMVRANVLAGTRRSGFLPAVGVADRGTGLTLAPQN